MLHHFVNIGAHLDTRISTMYSFIRQRMSGGSERTKTLAGTNGKETYTSHKCKWLTRTVVQWHLC